MRVYVCVPHPRLTSPTFGRLRMDSAGVRDETNSGLRLQVRALIGWNPMSPNERLLRMLSGRRIAIIAWAGFRRPGQQLRHRASGGLRDGPRASSPPFDGGGDPRTPTLVRTAAPLRTDMAHACQRALRRKAVQRACTKVPCQRTRRACAEDCLTERQIRSLALISNRTRSRSLARPQHWPGLSNYQRFPTGDGPTD